MSFFLDVRGLPLMLSHQMMVKPLVQLISFSISDDLNLCSILNSLLCQGPCCHHDPGLWVGTCLPWFHKVKNGRGQEKQAPFPLPFLPPSWKISTQELGSTLIIINLSEASENAAGFSAFHTRSDAMLELQADLLVLVQLSHVTKKEVET